MMEEIIEFIGIIIVLLLFIGVLSVFSIIISLKIAQKINDRRVKNNKYLKPNDK